MSRIHALDAAGCQPYVRRMDTVRTERVELRFTARERAECTGAARRDGVPLAVWLRSAGLKAARQDATVRGDHASPKEGSDALS